MMKTSRRDFLSGLGAVGTAMAVSRCFAQQKLATTGRSTIDPNFAVFLSDVHVNAAPKPSSHQYKFFIKTIDALLTLTPRPAHVVVFGDLAYGLGEKEDYAVAVQQFRRLEDVGIKVTIGMGNHDLRKTFLEAFPAYEKSTLVPGDIVSKISVGVVDLIMLDSLQEGADPADPRRNHVDGALSEAQQAWLVKHAGSLKRPTFFCSHHPTSDLKVNGKSFSSYLLSTPHACGHIYGHAHRWRKEWRGKSWGSTDTIRTLCLPSTGHWGDIGWTLFRTTETSATATLVQSDFFFPYPVSADNTPPHWKHIVTENQNQTCNRSVTGGVA